MRLLTKRYARFKVGPPSSCKEADDTWHDGRQTLQDKQKAAGYDEEWLGNFTARLSAFDRTMNEAVERSSVLASATAADLSAAGMFTSALAPDTLSAHEARSPAGSCYNKSSLFCASSSCTPTSLGLFFLYQHLLRGLLQMLQHIVDGTTCCAKKASSVRMQVPKLC